MNESEKKLAEFSVAKAMSSFEAEEKLISHKVTFLKIQAGNNFPGLFLCSRKKILKIKV